MSPDPELATKSARWRERITMSPEPDLALTGERASRDLDVTGSGAEPAPRPRRRPTEMVPEPVLQSSSWACSTLMSPDPC